MNALLRLALCAVSAAALSGLAAAATLEVAVTGADGKPLSDAVVFLESREARAAVKPGTSVEVAQQNKQFVQRVSIVTVGSLVQFPNRDAVRHHVYSFSPTKTFELKLYAGTPANPVLFDKPGVAVLGCNIHDSMVAWVLVVETPYYGQSGANGQIRLTDVPAGSYRLRSWHSGLATGAAALDQALTVAEAGSRVDVSLPVDAAATP